MVDRDTVCLLGHGGCPEICLAHRANKDLLEKLGVNPNRLSQKEALEILNALSEKSRNMLLKGCIKESVVPKSQANAAE